MLDKEIQSCISDELQRQNQGIELIASENYPSKDVREAQGSILTAKYAEGYPGKRYYGGCVNIDRVENLAIERAKKLFHVNYANVQPHSGSQANFAAYHALIQKGATVLSLVLNDGGHLTHGAPVSFSADTYNFVHYPLGEDGRLDYDKIKECLDLYDPDLFLAGYSAYPYAIDFKKMRELIDEHNAHSEKHTLFMVDMAHIAGIIAAGLTQNPCDYADLVTSTTHKTLRGPRGGLILTNDEAIAKRVNKSVFPYAQGGPLEHVIAGKAVAFLEDLQPQFKDYMKAVLENTAACDRRLKELGADVSGTENHLFLMNVKKSFGITGKEAENLLGEAGITVNKNMIHNDTEKPSQTSGLRIGFAAATTRGCTKAQAEEIADIIFDILKNGEEAVERNHQKVIAITSGWKKIDELSFLD